MKEGIIDPSLGELQDKVDRYHHNKMMGELQAELDAMTNFVRSLTDEEWGKIAPRADVREAEKKGEKYHVTRALYDYVREHREG